MLSCALLCVSARPHPATRSRIECSVRARVVPRAPQSGAYAFAYEPTRIAYPKRSELGVNSTHPIDIAAHRIASHSSPLDSTRRQTRGEQRRGRLRRGCQLEARRVALQLCSDTEYCSALDCTDTAIVSYRIVSYRPLLPSALRSPLTRSRSLRQTSMHCTRSPAAALCSCGGWRTLGSSGIGGAAPLPAAGF